MALRIPEQHYGAIRRLNALAPEATESIVAALGAVKPTLRIKDLVTSLSRRIKLPKGDAEEFVEVLIALYATRDSLELSLDEFLEELVSAARAQIPDIDSATHESWDGLRRNLHRLLDLEDPLGISAKSLGVMTDHARVFATARVISDVRPIFGATPGRLPVAATIVHNLKIEFSKRGRRHAFFVALDTHDLRRLRQVTDRALAKDRALRRLVSKSDVSFLDADSLKGA